MKGRVLLRIPPETQAGRVFRLAGQGMPRFRAEGFGEVLHRPEVRDLDLVLETPADLEQRTRELAMLRRLAT